MSSLHAEEAFLDHYQFSHDPFAPRVPGFKFFPAQRKPVLGQLHHLARYSQLLLVVTGPLGSGKSLLRQALVASTNKQVVHSVVASARNGGDAESVLRQVAQGIEAPRHEVGDLLAAINDRALAGQETYVLVDDAEQLEESALEALYGLAAGNGECRAHVFLFGEPSLTSQLEAFGAGAERHHILELQPYELAETQEYLAQRLEGAGQGIEVFSEEQIADIHEQSRGWPGVINQVARDTLIDNMLAERGNPRSGGLAFTLPRKHMVAAGVVIVAVAAAWFMRSGSSNHVSAPDVANNSAATAQPGAGGDKPVVDFGGGNQPLSLPLSNQSDPVVREPLAQAAGPEERDSGVAEMLAPPSGNTGAGRPSVAQPSTSALPAPSKPAMADIQSSPAAPEKPAAAARPQAPAAQAPAKPVTEPAKPQSAASSVGSSGGAAWYQGTAGSRYALQILGTSSEETARAFVAQHGSEYRYFRKMHDGKPLFVITYGSFADRAAAQAALKSLPAQIQAGKPWPRTFSSIQQDISSAR
ncbi:AAA family ATPase [Pseudomonas sp. Marseille-QA0892]